MMTAILDNTTEIMSKKTHPPPEAPLPCLIPEARVKAQEAAAQKLAGMTPAEFEAHVAKDMARRNEKARRDGLLS